MSATQQNGRTAPTIRFYQDVQTVSNFLRAHGDFVAIEDAMRDAMIHRLSIAIASADVDEKSYEILERPSWESGRAHYVAELPEGFRQRFLMYFWGLTERDLCPTKTRHTVTVNRWVEYPTQGVPKQGIEDTLGFWA